MSDWSIRRSITGCRILCRFASERGASLDELLAGTDISVQALTDSDTEVEMWQLFELVRNVIRLLPDGANLGMAVGRSVRLSLSGLWGFMLVSSPTARDAMETGLRYMDLLSTANHFRVEVVGDVGRLIIDTQGIPEDIRRFMVERDLGSLHTIANEISPIPVQCSALDLAFPRPHDLSMYSAMYSGEYALQPRFGCDTNCIYFDARLLSLPLPQANEMAQRLFQEQCRKVLERRRQRDGLGGRVRNLLLHHLQDMPDMEVVASELCVSSRHLRRQLLAEGTSYRGLVDEVRQTLAKELLGIPGMKLEEVANRLGYTERTSLVHAFKRWTGQSPSQARQDMLSQNML